MKDARGHGSNGKGGANARLAGRLEQMGVFDSSGQAAHMKAIDDESAASALQASSPKSAAAPAHEASATARGYNEYGSRHGYNPDAVNEAIASSNRHGRKIGGREASAIHRLLKGR